MGGTLSVEDKFPKHRLQKRESVTSPKTQQFYFGAVTGWYPAVAVVEKQVFQNIYNLDQEEHGSFQEKGIFDEESNFNRFANPGNSIIFEDSLFYEEEKLDLEKEYRLHKEELLRNSPQRKLSKSSADIEWLRPKKESYEDKFLETILPQLSISSSEQETRQRREEEERREERERREREEKEQREERERKERERKAKEEFGRQERIRIEREIKMEQERKEKERRERERLEREERERQEKSQRAIDERHRRERAQSLKQEEKKKNEDSAMKEVADLEKQFSEKLTKIDKEASESSFLLEQFDRHVESAKEWQTNLRTLLETIRENINLSKQLGDNCDHLGVEFEAVATNIGDIMKIREDNANVVKELQEDKKKLLADLKKTTEKKSSQAVELETSAKRIEEQLQNIEIVAERAGEFLKRKQACVTELERCKRSAEISCSEDLHKKLNQQWEGYARSASQSRIQANRQYQSLYKVSMELREAKAKVEQAKLSTRIKAQSKLKAELDEWKLFLSKLEPQVKIDKSLRASLSNLSKELEGMKVAVEGASLATNKERQRLNQLKNSLSKTASEMQTMKDIFSEDAKIVKELQKYRPPAIKYKAAKGDKIDDLISEYLRSTGGYHLPYNFERLTEGMYQFGTRKIRAQILNGRLVVRVGGGFMTFAEFVEKYGKTESVKIAKAQGSRAESHLRSIVSPSPELTAELSRVPRKGTRSPRSSSPVARGRPSKESLPAKRSSIPRRLSFPKTPTKAKEHPEKS